MDYFSKNAILDFFFITEKNTTPILQIFAFEKSVAFDLFRSSL